MNPDASGNAEIVVGVGTIAEALKVGGHRDGFRRPATNVNILEISHIQYCLYWFRSQTPAASSYHEVWRAKR